MLSHFLFLLLLLCVTNTIHAVADNEFPPYLSFHQYRSVQSFAGDEDNQLINELGNNGWDNSVLDTWYMNLNLAKQYRYLKTEGSNNNANDLFPHIICDTNESDRHGVDRYEFIESVLSNMVEENENENTSKYFIKRIPIYNRNHKSKNKDDNDEHILHGACFFSSIEVSLARSVEEEGVLVTPVAPFLKMRKNISGSLDNYDENSIDEDTISLAVTLAPGSFSSHDEAVEFASNVQQLQDMDQNDPFLAECDKKPYQRSSITVGSSNSFYFFFYELEKQDLVAGFTHKCHRLFLEHIVTKPQVISVEKTAKNTISNYHAKWIVESSVKEKNPLTDIGLSGNGEVIFVADTGLDQKHCYIKDYSGDTVPLTTDFDLTGKINHGLRKVVQYAVLNDIGIDSDDQDLNGHGTHVVGTIVGKRLNGNGQETQGVGEGIASSAKVAFYDGNSGDSKDVSVNSIISQFFYFGKKAGARINSSSWNSGLFGEYEEKSRQVDEYFYNDPDDEMLMINSSGNDGETDTGTATVGTVKYPCVSKNALCIGASHNYESDMDDIDVVAFFSSYGPTADGRIKPDLIAPGHRILSLEANSNKCGASQYDSAGNNDGLTFKSGTSMACPVVAGAGALVREYFTAGYYPSGEKGIEKMDISGSLLKAVLINGAVELKRRSKPGGGYEDSEYYDRYQGYGIINLVNSLKLANEVSSPDLYVENERLIEKGQTHEYVFDDVCNDHEFRVTLVWRDPPSDSGCVECLVNDLDLEVLYDGTTYYPNGRSNRDEKNNVERVILKTSKFVNPNGNTIRVRVKTANFGAGVSQKYSLASTGCFNSAEVEFDGPDLSPICGSDEFEYSIDIFTNRKPEETSWLLEYQGSKGNLAAARAGQYDEMLHLYRESGCATVGECLIFVIRDTDFDGLCCEKGMGSYLIRAGGEILARGDSFGGRQEIEKICYYEADLEDQTPSPTVLVCGEDEFKYQIDIETDLFPDETRWELKRSRIDGVDMGYYTETGREYYEHEGCLDLALGGCYSFYIYGFSGVYTIMTNGIIILDGETFYIEDEKDFCYSGETSSPTITPSPTRFPCNDDQFHYLIKIEEVSQFYLLDMWWGLYPLSLVDSVPYMTYQKSLESYSHTGCARYDECYEFWIYDVGFDGLCCFFGSGSFKLSVDNEVVFKKGQFDRSWIQSWFPETFLGYYDIYKFCPERHPPSESPPSGTIQPTSKPSEMVCGDNEFKYRIQLKTNGIPNAQLFWMLKYSNETEIKLGGPFLVENYLYNSIGCVPLNECYLFSLSTVTFSYLPPDYLCCEYGSGWYKVFADELLVLEGVKLESTTFCYGPSVSNYPTTQPTESYGIRTATVGNPDYNSKKFNDVHPPWQYGKIVKIRIQYFENEKIISIGITYENGKSFSHGGISTNKPIQDKTIFLDENQYIIKVSGRSSDDINMLKFYTNDGNTFGPYGSNYYGVSFEFDFSENVLVYIFGRAGPGVPISELGFAYASISQTTPIPTVQPTQLSQPTPICENGPNNYYSWCGYWSSIGLCENSDWMLKNCAKTCANCCTDYNENECEYHASHGRCTDTSLYKKEGYYSYYYNVSWKDWMQGSCRKSCNTCDVDFTSSSTPSDHPVTCSSDEFKYEIVATNDEYYGFSWSLHYKYREHNDEISFYDMTDGFNGYLPPDYEKRFYGCAKYSCFFLDINGAYLKISDADKGVVIGQNTELFQKIRFCNYTPQPTTSPTISVLPSTTPVNPPQDAIFTITLSFDTSISDEADYISAVVYRSIQKIMFCAEENHNFRDNLIEEIKETSSCENDICDTSFQVCNESCENEDEIEEETLVFLVNTMNDALASKELLLTIQQTGHHMDMNVFNSLTTNDPIRIEFDFGRKSWPTASPTTSKPTTTPTQECCNSSVVQNLFGFITKIFEPITEAIANTTDPISDVLFGVESYDSSGITCADKMFELQLEIKTDGTPDKTSWELTYENGTIIESIGQGTYSECDTVYNHSYCLDTSCFVFNLFDSFEFKGSYNITVGDTVLAQQDSFLWWKESKRFCYPRCDDNNMFALQIELKTDDWPHETSWDLKFDNGTLVDSVDERYYTRLNTVYNHRYCLYDGCYDVTFHDHIGDGMCCSYGSGYFKIKSDSRVIREGDEFEKSNRKSFCHITAETIEENSSSLFGIITDLFDENCCTTDMTRTGYPTPVPSPYPTTKNPTSYPTITTNPTVKPSSNPTTTSRPSLQPSSQPSSQPSLQPSFTTPPIIDYKIFLDGESWNGIKWLDKSTHWHHSESPHGIINTAVDVNNNGMTYLYGDIYSGITLTSGWPSGSEYTLFHVTKYNGANKHRIWTGTTGNWFSGHHGGRRGVFFHEGWISQYAGDSGGVSVGDVDSWGIFTDRVNSSGSNVRVDGVDVTTNSSPNYNPGGMGINIKYNEDSDWAAALVLVYDRYLDEDEVLSVEDWIRTEYLSSYSYNPSFNPTTTSQPSSSPTIIICNENEFKYEVIITTDRYAYETYWELSYDDGTIIDGVEYGYYTEKETQHVHNGCLDLDSCITFTIFDTQRDGICCEYGNGGYTVLANDVVVAEGGEFGDYETKEFCYPE